jgi:DNA-binding XRE family transcriptional regulator
MSLALRGYGDNVPGCLMPALRSAAALPTAAPRAARLDVVARDCRERPGAIITRPLRDEADWSKRALQVRGEYLTEMRKKAGMTQAEVAEAMGVSQQRVSAIESGSVAELATLADCIRALGGELKVIADFGGLMAARRLTTRAADLPGTG